MIVGGTRYEGSTYEAGIPDELFVQKGLARKNIIYPDIDHIWVACMVLELSPTERVTLSGEEVACET